MRMVWASTSASAQGLNESPSEKEGKYSFETMADFEAFALNESPSEKEGKSTLSSPSRGTAGVPQ